MNTNKNNLKILHINTQSLTSSFDEFLLQQTKYNFDIVAMSETWLKNNDLLIKHVTIPGYDMLYKNREKVRHGGVGFYISNNLKYEHQKHLESRFNELEHLWVKLPSRN